MNIRKTIFFGFFLLAVPSCSHKTVNIISRTSVKIPIDSQTDLIADKEYEHFLQPYKQKIDLQMNEVIGQATVNMKGHTPESLLSNFTSDVYLQAACNFTGTKVDIAIVNMGSLRTEVLAGSITVRKVFELMPFENELVVLQLKGDKLYGLLQQFASVGGQGVAGLRMVISGGKATDITIDGQPLDKNKVYSIATNDYLAGGNDGMVQLAQYENRVNTGLKIRTVLLNYIKSETAKGNQIQSKLDGRISIQ